MGDFSSPFWSCPVCWRHINKFGDYQDIFGATYYYWVGDKDYLGTNEEANKKAKEAAGTPEYSEEVEETKLFLHNGVVVSLTAKKQLCMRCRDSIDQDPYPEKEPSDIGKYKKYVRWYEIYSGFTVSDSDRRWLNHFGVI